MINYSNSNPLENLLSTAVNNNSLFSVTIELLTKCNWKCKHCYIPLHNNCGLSKHTIFNIFDQLKNLNTFEIVLTGGEIFIRDDIIEIIQKARQMFFKVTLLTNISLLNEDIIFKLSELYLYNISCTIFSLNESIHDSITGIPGSLKKALKNIMLIKKYNIPLEIKTVLMYENYNSYKELKEFCINNGFKYLLSPIISIKHDGNKSPQKLKLSEKQLEDMYTTINDFYPENKSQNDYICNTIRYSFCIGSNGDIYPCNAFSYSVGNIHHDSLSKIWHSEQLEKIKNIKWNDLENCSSCKLINFCHKCPGITLLEEGDIHLKSSLACEHANVRHKLFTERRAYNESIQKA